MDIWSMIWLGSAIIGIPAVIAACYFEYRSTGIFTIGDLFLAVLAMVLCCLPIVGTIFVLYLLFELDKKIGFGNIVIFRKGN